MDTRPQSFSSPPEDAFAESAQSRRAERAVLLLYAFFFLLWCLGLVLAFLPGTGGSRILGLPLWFSVSCLIAYGAVCAALAVVAGRYFR